MLESPLANKRSWFLVGTVVLFVAILGFSIYFSVKLKSVKNDLAALTAQKESITSLQNSDEEGGIAMAIAIKNKLDEITDVQLPWSLIIEKIENTVPKLRDTNGPIISLQSYNGNEEGNISVSASTRPDAFDPFADIALLIRAFVNEPSFASVFVPSITKTINQNGASILTFAINFEYQKTNF